MSYGVIFGSCLDHMNFPDSLPDSFRAEFFLRTFPIACRNIFVLFYTTWIKEVSTNETQALLDSGQDPSDNSANCFTTSKIEFKKEDLLVIIWPCWDSASQHLCNMLHSIRRRRKRRRKEGRLYRAWQSKDCLRLAIFARGLIQKWQSSRWRSYN